ncbi:serine hydrolase [Polaribacter glomeratus]|uniref:beta-lactamase n=1 Tax=Polaribacter glomeratus TaxID=102 RepID=A0A2S7WXH0_9FLAO|nr:serine hydrolase [Polaribacter glomeratus]PQJ82304.1 hypothetical protein BTO16_06810 [Polaribacter glomeratus]TXD66897.1 serine hydrolase [Polaribacter glomeratus]
MKLKYIFLTLAIAISISFLKYPIDGYDSTGIARLYQLKKMRLENKKNTRIPIGAYKNLADIKLNLLSKSNDSIESLLVNDPEFSKKMKQIIPAGNYSLSVLDMTNPEKLRYASYNENKGYQPGSVGKLAVLLAVMDQLEKLCPDWEDRAAYLKNIRVSARYWGVGDHHTIPVYDIKTDKLTKRTVKADDVFSLYEWLDHMISVSNNGAASIMYREAMLMAAFQQEYFFLTDEKAENYFKTTPRATLTNLANTVVNEPLRKLGISEEEWKLGGMFTRSAEKYVGRKGGSIGSPKGLMKFLAQIEQGKAVDKAASLEMKRLMYSTDRRIRYARSPRLDSAAVYFKSGSYYKCDRVLDPNCKNYAGNVYNYMNSVIIVEHPNNSKYIVCLMSNVLNKNSAGNHLYLASKIDDNINDFSKAAKTVIRETEYKEEKDESGGN